MERGDEYADVRTRFVRRSPTSYFQRLHHPSHRALAKYSTQWQACLSGPNHSPEARAAQRRNRNHAFQPDAGLQPHHRDRRTGPRRFHPEDFLKRTQSAPPANRPGDSRSLWPADGWRSARHRRRDLVLRLPAHARKHYRSRHLRGATEHHWAFCSRTAQKLLRGYAMQFGLSESQEFLKDSARKFFAGECPSAEMRRLMETDTAYDAGLWSKLTHQGYTGIIFPEEYGGVGLGQVELMLLMEEAGRALLPGPFFSTVVLAGSVLDAVCTPALKSKYLAPICRGETRATVAILEANASWNPRDIQLTATNGKLSGEKLFVPDAAVADFIVVVARNGVFVVDSKAPGLKISPMSGMDLTRKLYVVQFSNTPAEELGSAAQLPRAFDIATTALAAELVGGMQRTLEITVEYAKTRKQFGKPIGSFQAVQHQCADMYLETESSRSAVYYAGWALEEKAPDASTAVSIAKMYASDAARTVGNRGIQIHGGMGFTWENDLHLYYRRAKASETAFGDATFHRERIASTVIDAGNISAKTA